MKKNKTKSILTALHQYYSENISFEKAAEKARVPLFLFIKFVSDNNLPIIHSKADAEKGLKQLLRLCAKLY